MTQQSTDAYSIRPGTMAARDVYPALSVTPTEDTRTLGTAQVKNIIQQGVGQNVVGQPVGWWLALVFFLIALHFAERHLRGRK